MNNNDTGNPKLSDSPKLKTDFWHFTVAVPLIDLAYVKTKDDKVTKYDLRVVVYAT